MFMMYMTISFDVLPSYLLIFGQLQFFKNQGDDEMRILLPIMLAAAGIALVGCDSSSKTDDMVDGQPAVTVTDVAEETTETMQPDTSDMNSNDVAPTEPAPTDMEDITPAPTVPTDMSDGTPPPPVGPAPVEPAPVEPASVEPTPSDMDNFNEVPAAPSNGDDADSSTTAPEDENADDTTMPVPESNNLTHDMSVNQNQPPENQQNVSNNTADVLSANDATSDTSPKQNSAVENITSEVSLVIEAGPIDTINSLDENPLSDITSNNPATTETIAN
jgi:hypothetical protein